MMYIEKLKQKILDLAIRGKLVPQDPNDEPASVLIKKIKEERERLIKEGKIKKPKEESYIYKGSDNCYYENNTKINFNPSVSLNSNFIWIKGKDILFPMESLKPTNDFDYIDIESIDNKLCIINNTKHHTVKTAPSRATRKIYSSSTLFSMVRPYLKNVAHIGEKYKNCIASTGFYVCTPMPFINEDYLYFLLTSNFVINSLNYHMKGDNSPSINGSDIEEFYFPIPPLSYQEKVATEMKLLIPKIEKIQSDLIDLNETICKIKYKILDEIFGENSRYKSYYEKISTIGNEIQLFDNYRKPVNSSERQVRKTKNKVLYPYYGATGLVDYIDDYILDGEYVLLGEDGAPFLNKYLSKAYIVNGKIWVNNHVHILQSKNDNRFLLHYLNWFDYNQYVSGTTRLKLNQENMKSIPFPILKYSHQVEIANKIESSLQILNTIKKQLI